MVIFAGRPSLFANGSGCGVTRRRSGLVGLPVITLDGGRQIGEVEDVICSAPDGRIIGFILRGGGWLAGRRVYPYEEVEAVGPDAILVRNPRAVLTTRKQKELNRLRERHISLVGKRVLSRDGHDIGVIDDLLFDETGGRIVGYGISGGIVQDLLAGKGVIAADLPMVWGDEAVIVQTDYGSSQGSLE